MSPAVESTQAPPSQWWNYLLADTNATIRLWCFPVVGAGAAVWHPWTKHLGSHTDLLSICLPGREGRLAEAPITRMSDLVAAIAAGLAPFMDGRDVFCGHGMGGLLAFEICRALRRSSAPVPRALVICSVVAPCARQKTARHGERLHQLGDPDVATAIRKLRSSGYDRTITLEVFARDRHFLAYSRDRLRTIWEDAA